MDIYQTLTTLDFAVMIGYVLVIIGMGAWISLRHRQRAGHLFLAQHSLGWPSIGLTMWGTNVGPSMLIASCGIAYTTGIVATNFSWLAFLFIFLLAVVFAPFYRPDAPSGYISLAEATRSDTSRRGMVYLAWGLLIAVMLGLYLAFN
jgi:SSS family solute:Na+ symporter